MSTFLDEIPFTSIAVQHLQRLCDEGVTENDTLEYKQEQYGKRDEDKREFLKDITGLANHVGGHLLIGVTQDKNGVVSLSPVSTTGLEAELLRLTSLASSSISPRLPMIECRHIEVGPSFVIDVLPFSHVSGELRVGHRDLHNFWNHIPLIGGNPSNYKYNFDGFRVEVDKGAYVHVFRTGAIESVRHFSVSDSISLQWVEDMILEHVPDYIGITMNRVGAPPPYFIGVSLLNIYKLAISESQQIGYRVHLEKYLPAFDRDNLELPSAVITGTVADGELPHIVRPTLDALWNVMGMPGSPSFRQGGRFYRSD